MHRLVSTFKLKGLHTCVCVRARSYVCEWRERESERERDKERERETEREREYARIAFNYCNKTYYPSMVRMQ